MALTLVDARHAGQVRGGAPCPSDERSWSCFAFIGATAPFGALVDPNLNLGIGRLFALVVTVLLLNRMPIILLLKPLTPALKTWREAAFVGHFGPIGVGASALSIVSTQLIAQSSSRLIARRTCRRCVWTHCWLADLRSLRTRPSQRTTV